MYRLFFLEKKFKKFRETAVPVCRCYIGGRGAFGVFCAISYMHIYRYIGIAHFAQFCAICAYLVTDGKNRTLFVNITDIKIFCNFFIFSFGILKFLRTFAAANERYKRCRLILNACGRCCLCCVSLSFALSLFDVLNTSPQAGRDTEHTNKIRCCGC